MEEHLHPEVFGSAYAIFASHTGARFRLVWDGKESCGFLQSNSSGDEWKNEGPLVRERVGSTFSNLPEFLAMADRLIAGGDNADRA